ncbi:MAG: PAS domain S-box protein [Planctomycetes bacterium]|nr:PAS domain S-box protein [Planctomycetota bacterium]
MTEVATPNLATAAVPERDAHEWAEALFDGIDDAIFVHDRDGNILEVNPAACRRLGYTREELLRLNTRDIDDPELAAGFEERLRTQLASGNLRCEGRHRAKDGRLIYVDINTSAIRFRGQSAVLAVIRDITDRKRAEGRLQAQFAVARVLAEGGSLEECGRKLLQVLSEALGCDAASIFVVNRDKRLLECLETWHQAGLGAPEFETMTRRICFPQGNGLPGRVWATSQPAVITDLALDANFPRLDIALREGLRSACAFPILLGNETVGVIEFFHRGRQLPDPDLVSLMASFGSQIGFVLERQRIEKALRNSEALYQSLVDCLPQNIFRKDREGRLTFCNKLYCATLKRPLAELLGKTDFDLFPIELAAKYVRDDQKVLQSGETIETFERHLLPDGTSIYVQVVKTPVRDIQGDIIGTQGIFWDVTEKKRAEEMIADSERRYRQLTEATQDAIVVADQFGMVSLFNPSAQRMFGYSAEEIIGQPVTQLMPVELRGLHERGLARYLKTRQPRVIGHIVEMHGRRKDGSEFPLELALSAISLGPPGPDGREPVQFLGAMRDLTERNRIRSMLIQNERLASIGLLSAGVAHEINNPLAFVANNLVVLERDTKGLMELLNHYVSHWSILAGVNDEVAARAESLALEVDLEYVRENLPRLIKRTRDGVDRVSRIVQSLRGLARTDAPKRQDTHIPDLVENSLEMLRGRLRRSNIEVLQEHDALPRAPCVSSQIGQVLLNLLVNAVQAVETVRPHGGRIVVRTCRLTDEMLIEVEDNGCGIEPVHLPRLFDPFFTTKDVGEGTGLGLSISHNIVTGHGGRLEVRSKPGEGSAFRMYLPLNHTS